MALFGPSSARRSSCCTFFFPPARLFHSIFLCSYLLDTRIPHDIREYPGKREREKGQPSIVKVVVVRRAVRSFHILLLCSRARDSCPSVLLLLLLLLLLQDLLASICSLCACWGYSAPRARLRRDATHPLLFTFLAAIKAANSHDRIFGR